jgi:glycerophosphoryl diester phosphodiesterase
MPLIAKLLSHRLRGFAQSEHTRSALEAACASDSAFLEVDVRVSREGEMFVWHDPRTRKLGNIDLSFATTHAKDLSLVRHQNGETILNLSEALRIFSSNARPGQKFCIDIKDFGFEEGCLQMVREAGLESRVCFVSWIPQTLLRLRELHTSAPLILSCCNLFRLGPVGAVLDSLLANSCLRLGWIVLLGRNKASSRLGSLAHGFQHAFFCRRVPTQILEALTSSGGGICVHHLLVGHKLIKYCQDSGLQLWVFSAATTQQFVRYSSNAGIDVVFCDDVPAVLKELHQIDPPGAKLFKSASTSPL